MKTVTIISTTNLPGVGIIAELQHNENGLPKGTKLRDTNAKETFIVEKRVFDSSLMMAGNETYFECETESTSISLHDDHETNNRYVESQMMKRRSKIFMYLLTNENNITEIAEKTVLTIK